MGTQAHHDFDKSMERAKTLLDVHEFMTREPGRPPVWATDILRATLVFIMASWDSYLHDIVHENCYRVIQKQRGLNLPKKLVDVLKEAIPYEKLLAVWHGKKAGVRVSTAIRKRLAANTYMKSAKAEEALRMLGIETMWRIVGKAMRRRQDSLRNAVDAFARRRDRIVHEGDVGKATRTKGRLARIERSYVADAFITITAVVESLDRFVERHLASSEDS